MDHLIRDRRTALRVLVIASALLSEGLVLVDVRGPVRGIVVAWFVTVCPGLALVLVMGLSDRLMQVILSIALSLSLALAVATAMVLLGMWSPLGGLSVLVIITVLAGLLGPMRSVIPR